MISNRYTVHDVADPKDIISDYFGKTGDLLKGLKTAIVSGCINACRSWTGFDMVDCQCPS